MVLGDFTTNKNGTVADFSLAQPWWAANHTFTGTQFATYHLKDDVPFSEAGLRSINGISAVEKIEDSTDPDAPPVYAIHINPQGMTDLNGDSFLDPATGKMKDVYRDGDMIALVPWIAVKDDDPAMRRWQGGAFVRGSEDPRVTTMTFYPGAYRPMFVPIGYIYLEKATAPDHVSAGQSSVQEVSGGVLGVPPSTTAPPVIQRPPPTQPVRQPTRVTVASQVTLRSTGANGDVRGSTAYFGSGYSHSGGSNIQFNNPSALQASRVRRGTLTFRIIHTYRFSGATVTLNFGGGVSRTVNVPYSGTVNITLTAAQAQQLASSRSVRINSGGGISNYGYAAVGSFRAVLKQS